uniref:Glia maturation factor beta n=1 Tax=Gallus gallus TaxID=9031 RepID=A0A8V0ZF63_CHICK
MSESLVVCDVAEDLVEKLRKFRFRKETNNAAIIMKIDKDKQLVVLDEEHEGISPDELKDELPERQPRFIVYSYKYQHEDGRVSYPLCFIFSSPVGCKPEQQMMYAGSKNKLVQTAELTKVSTKITAKGDSLERRKELLQSDEGSRFCISASLRLLLNDLWYLRLCPCSGTLHLEFFTVHLECFCFFHLRISALDAALQVLQKAN